MLEREKDDAARVKQERDIAAAVRKRDGRCRWPEVHKCRFGFEAAHVEDKSLCGETSLANELLLCAWIHRRGPESIHGKQLKIEVDKADPVNPCFSFWRQTDSFDELGQPIYALVAREVRPFEYERD